MKINLSLELVKIIASLILGLFIGFKLFSKTPEAKIEYKEKTVFVEKKSGSIKRKINTDGSIDEVETYLSERKSKKLTSLEQSLKPEDNLFFLVDKRSIEAVFRLEHFLGGVGYDVKTKETLYKLGYSTRIF